MQPTSTTTGNGTSTTSTFPAHRKHRTRRLPAKTRQGISSAEQARDASAVSSGASAAKTIHSVEQSEQTSASSLSSNSSHNSSNRSSHSRSTAGGNPMNIPRPGHYLNSHSNCSTDGSSKNSGTASNSSFHPSLPPLLKTPLDPNVWRRFPLELLVHILKYHSLATLIINRRINKFVNSTVLNLMEERWKKGYYRVEVKLYHYDGIGTRSCERSYHLECLDKGELIFGVPYGRWAIGGSVGLYSMILEVWECEEMVFTQTLDFGSDRETENQQPVPFCDGGVKLLFEIAHLGPIVWEELRIKQVFFKIGWLRKRYLMDAKWERIRWEIPVVNDDFEGSNESGSTGHTFSSGNGQYTTTNSDDSRGTFSISGGSGSGSGSGDDSDGNQGQNHCMRLGPR